jgi:hypothetical protein
MNEISKTPAPAANAGGKPAAAVNSPVAKPAVQPVAVAAPAVQPPAAFGGHRGGGKKRLDGLAAGSPEAIAADRAKDRERKNQKNALKKVAELPPVLPGAPAPGTNPPAAVAGDPNALPVPAAGALLAPVAAPLFVAWNQKLLEKPARLLTKIIDRVRCWGLMKKIKQLELTPEQEKEIAADLKFKEEVCADFSAALAECATVELNKRRVAGSEHGHWINLGMCSGEMVLVHMQTMDRLEKMVASNAAAKKEAKEKPETKI